MKMTYFHKGNVFLAGTLFYGGIRSIYYSGKMVDRENYRMPIGWRLFGIVVSTTLSRVFFPFYLLEDINYMDKKYFMKKPINEKIFPFDGYRILENQNFNIKNIKSI
jgi:hypothetical protein